MLRGESGPALAGPLLHRGEKLERDKTAQPRVLGFVDDAAPAATELLDDALMQDGLANHC